MKIDNNGNRRPWWLAATMLVCVLSVLITCGVFLWVGTHVGVPGNTAQAGAGELGLMDRFDMRMTNEISNALEGILSVKKVYWLDDADLVAPEPDQSKFGATTDPARMQEFLDQAAELLEGQKTLFTPDVKLYGNSEVNYYLDDTILVITWREVIHDCVYTISEVKIAHPSQLRRFLSDGAYGTERQYYTTQMAATVNAVTASSGDFYRNRQMGLIVYEGQVKRMSSRVDTCFITDQGDMLFSYRGQLKTEEEAQKFVDENHVRFSLSFGPVLVDNYQKVPQQTNYPLGEVKDKYSRAALAKMGELHYLLIAANLGDYGDCRRTPTMEVFANQMVAFGVEKAYALDGGQTAVVVTNDKLMNRPDWGHQRTVSDIIYFATAIPESFRAEEPGDTAE